VIQLLQHLAIAANQTDTLGQDITTTLWRVCEHSGEELGRCLFRPTVRCGTTNRPEEFSAFRAVTERKGLPGREASTLVSIHNMDKDANSPAIVVPWNSA
jgi:hypothetical protein